MTLTNTIRTIDRTTSQVEARSDARTVRDLHRTGITTASAEIDGDKIYNGALDNATGVGGLIELARAYSALPTPPKRSLLFLSVTAEEQGLVGSDYYARNPIYPLAKTLGVINMDSLNIYGKTRDLVVVGLGNSDLDDYARDAAAEQGRVVRPDPSPEKGGYFRSDHFPFAKQGVPAINAGGGDDYVGRPAGWGQQVEAEYTAKHYHKPSDEVRPDWDLAGAVQDLQIYFAMGHRVAQADTFPDWKPGNPFKAKRDNAGAVAGFNLLSRPAGVARRL